MSKQYLLIATLREAARDFQVSLRPVVSPIHDERSAPVSSVLYNL